jgi:hypothetical protein
MAQPLTSQVAPPPSFSGADVNAASDAPTPRVFLRARNRIALSRVLSETGMSTTTVAWRTSSELVPNSPAWLAALERVNPYQAAMTRAIVARAGTEAVCSGCGSDQPKDYVLPGILLRGRFCEPCRDTHGAI